MPSDDSSPTAPPRPETRTPAWQRELEQRTTELANVQRALSSSEARQRESQELFAKSFHANPTLMSIARVSDGRFIEVNAALARASGYKREEIIGRTALEIDAWTDLARRDEFYRLIRTHGQVRDFEADFRPKQGGPRHLLINADLIEMQGEPCILNVGIDITQRRRDEQVQAATYRISQVGLAGGDLGALFAEVHRIIGGLMPAKNFYVACLNADESELSFPFFVDEHVVSPPSRKPANGFTEYLLHTRQPLLADAATLAGLLSARGYYQPVERPAAQRLGAPLLIDGRAIGVIALQDYTNPRAYREDDLRLLTFVAEQTAAAIHRHRSGAALVRAETKYRAIFENALEGLYLSSPDGKFLGVNTAFARLMGYSSPVELVTEINDIGRQLYVNPKRREEFFQLMQGGDEVTDFESEIMRRDGSRLWISESVRAVRDEQGTLDHFEGVVIDITQQRGAARALQAAKEAADTASRTKSHFLASVSHELRTPLNGILGYTQILRRDTALGERQRAGVKVIHESAEHLLALINDVLDLSKIEAGRIELHPADFDLHEFAAGVERVFVPRAREKSLLLETALAPGLPRFVHGDEQRLRQVVFNLVANAVKFTPSGGVVFSVQPAEAGQIRFSVSDTGPGIAPENFERIFEPFTQLGERAPTATGTGLGLGISRSLVQHMQGQLRVESHVGWGSRFWFEVPLPTVTGTATEARPARRVLGYEGPRRRVLVVDDNTANRGVMTGMLEPLGFVVAEAASAEAALATAADFHPELVLMDLRLSGGIDGFEATRRLRAGAEGHALRVIAVSASAYDFDRRECLEAGCDDFLAKPFREEQLWVAVERSLGLAWHYADAEETVSPFPTVLHPPTPADAAVLYELARKGDVVGIRAHAQALAARDPQLAPFVQGVLELAGRFKLKAVRQFVGRFRNGPNDTPSFHG